MHARIQFCDLERRRSRVSTSIRSPPDSIPVSLWNLIAAHQKLFATKNTTVRHSTPMQLNAVICFRIREATKNLEGHVEFAFHNSERMYEDLLTLKNVQN